VYPSQQISSCAALSWVVEHRGMQHGGPSQSVSPLQGTRRLHLVELFPCCSRATALCYVHLSYDSYSEAVHASCRLTDAPSCDITARLLEVKENSCGHVTSLEQYNYNENHIVVHSNDETGRCTNGVNEVKP